MKINRNPFPRARNNIFFKKRQKSIEPKILSTLLCFFKKASHTMKNASKKLTIRWPINASQSSPLYFIYPQVQFDVTTIFFFKISQNWVIDAKQEQYHGDFKKRITKPESAMIWSLILFVLKIVKTNIQK